MKKKYLVLWAVVAGLCLSACGESSRATLTDKETMAVQKDESQSSVVQTSDMFTKRDKETQYDPQNCGVISLEGDSATSNAAGVKVNGSTVTITKEGTYLLTGSLKNGSIVIEADQREKIQLILNQVNISCKGSAPIYVKQADKVFITLAPDSENILENTGEFVSIDENNIDGAIFSKEDLTLNGLGKLSVSSEYGHGIVSKDDLVITGGDYKMNVAKHAFAGKDSVRIADGRFGIVAGKDGFNSGNEEEEEQGFVYIEGGNIQIEECYEGIEGRKIEIAGGDISIVASDDGLNATDGSSEAFGFKTTNDTGISIHISGGTTYIKAGGDGIDSNGGLYVTGGRTFISGGENGGNGALDYAGDATISGGIFVAVGSSGMAMNFGNASTQGTALITISNMQESGSQITLKDNTGKDLISYEAQVSFNSVLVSCPELVKDASYTLWTGDVSTDITMTELVYGNGGMKGPGGMGRPKGMGEPGSMKRPEGMGEPGSMKRPEGMESA